MPPATVHLNLKHPGNEVSAYYCDGWDLRLLLKRFGRGSKEVLRVFCSCIFLAFDCITSSRNPASKTEHLANNRGLWHNAFKLWIHSHLSPRVCPLLTWLLLDKDKAFFSSSHHRKNCQDDEKCAEWWRGMRWQGGGEEVVRVILMILSSWPRWCGKLCGPAEIDNQEDEDTGVASKTHLPFLKQYLIPHII